MDKVWLYVGGIMVAMAVLAYFTLSSVSKVPPTGDLRAAYEKVK
jgi:hypothetical protein